MAVMTFAAIDIGSYEVSMKIFEMSKRIGFRELNDVRYSLEIGKGVYSDGKIDSEMLNVLCEVLNDFKRLMPFCANALKIRKFTPITPTIPRPVTVIKLVSLMDEIPLMALEPEFTSCFMIVPSP